MSKTIGLWHKATYRDGETGYYADHVRGTLEVLHDSKRYIYEQPPYPRHETKALIAQAFEVDRVAGRWPYYEVQA